MKFGHFCLPTYYPDVYPSVAAHMRHLVDFMAGSEELGFDALWANEHHFHAYGGHIPSVPIFLAALAQRTKRVRLGSSIIVMPLHNPIEVAEQLAMVDLMSGGRLELGLGRGFVVHDHETFGIDIADGQALTTEGLEVVLKAWTGKPFTYHGKHFKYENLTVWPKPEQDPHPPIWMACSNTPASFEWTARQGYKLLTVAYVKPLPVLAANTQLYREAWVASGRDLANCDICTHYQIVCDEDGDVARRRAKQALERYTGLLQESLRQAKNVNEALRQSAAEDVDIEHIVEQGRMCVGTPDECLAVLQRAQDELGVTVVDGNFLFGGMTYEEADRSIRLFANEVMPRMRDQHPAWKRQLAAAH
ncbi:MAG TPA: LLM class flavin-dependent oxidoreductase [Chloroflexota bacterium]|nr:LLM class flavin-dependent oxidoreductase [Chloroflexota bacterium]